MSVSVSATINAESFSLTFGLEIVIDALAIGAFFISNFPLIEDGLHADTKKQNKVYHVIFIFSRAGKKKIYRWKDKFPE